MEENNGSDNFIKDVQRLLTTANFRGESNNSYNFIEASERLLMAAKIRGALKELEDRHSLLIDSILKEPAPAKTWLRYKFDLDNPNKCGGPLDDAYYTNLDENVRKRAVYTRILMHLSSKPYPVVGGFVRDFVIRIKDGKDDDDSTNICNDLDIVVPTLEEAIMLRDELTVLIPNQMYCETHRQKEDGTYPNECVRMFFHPKERTRVSNHYWEYIGVDIIITPDYVPTDFYENDIAFYPPPNIPTNLQGLQEWDLRRIAKEGKLVSSEEVVNNLRDRKLTIKESFLETMRKAVQEVRNIPKDAKENEEYEQSIKHYEIFHRLQRGFYRSAEIFKIDEKGERVKIKEGGSKDFLLVDLVL